MTEETQAQLLADWLQSPPGTPAPEDLAPDVLAGVYALRPDRAPPLRVTIEDILGSLTTGPLVAGDVAAEPPVDAPTRAPDAGAAGRQAMAARRAAATRIERAPSQRRRAMWWAVPGVGIAVTAAALALVVVKVGVPGAEQSPEMARFSAPDVTAASKPAPEVAPGAAAPAPMAAPAQPPEDAAQSAPVDQPVAATGRVAPAQAAPTNATSVGWGVDGSTARDIAGGDMGPPAAKLDNTDAAERNADKKSEGIAEAQAPQGAPPSADWATPTTPVAQPSRAPPAASPPPAPALAASAAPSASAAPRASAHATTPDTTILEGEMAPNADLSREADDVAGKDAQAAAPMATEEKAKASTGRAKTSTKAAMDEAAPASAAAGGSSGYGSGTASTTGTVTGSAAPLDYNASFYKAYSDVAVAFGAAVTAEDSGRYADALATFAGFVASAHTDVAQDAAWRAGRCLRSLGRLDDALTTVQTGLRRSSANTPYRVNLLNLEGEIENAQGRATDAQKAWTEAAKLNGGR